MIKNVSACLIFFSIFFTGCNNTANHPSENHENVTNAYPQTPLVKQARIASVLTTIFNVKYPNYASNEILRKKAAKELEIALDTLVRLKYLEDIPMKVLRIKSLSGEKALVHFYSDAESTHKLLTNKIGFDILAYTSEKEAASINDKSMYYLRGHNYKILSEGGVFNIVNQVYYSPGVSVEKEVLSEEYWFNLGDFSCQLDSVVEK